MEPDPLPKSSESRETPPALEVDRMAEVLRDSLREQSFWTQVQEMGPKLRMLALAIFALACLFAGGLWLLHSTVEGQKAVKEREKSALDTGTP